MNKITASDLKMRGVSALEEGLQDPSELMITVRGKEKYVVLKLGRYHYLREMELDVALLEAKQGIKRDFAISKTTETHVQNIFK